MKLIRKAGVTIAAAALGLTVLGVTAPAHADSQWPCGGCLTAQPGPGSH